ncbi:rifampicin resistance protein [Equine molluscum contagiosum-like virus]|nr:rifampicin resistance protein [Equine molluscum contagiosum-like virus]
MNASIINSLVHAEDAVRRANVFSFDIQQPTLYMPQYISVSGVLQQEAGAHPVASYEVRDQYITAMNHLVLALELPEVKGQGRFAYIPHVGYKCIRSVAVTSVNGTIWETSGEELFDSVRGHEAALELAGFSHELNDISRGTSHNDTIKDATTVYVYLRSPFDVEHTFGSLKLSDAKITITVTFHPIVDVLVHDAAFDVESFARSFVYVSELSFVGYMVRNLHAKPSYLEIARRQVGQMNLPTAVVTDVHAATSLAVYVKPYYGAAENKFVAYPGFSQSEKSYVHAFVDRLLEDLVLIAGDYPQGFPDSADIVEVPASGLVTIQDAEVLVKIDNVPAGQLVWFHTNLLVFGTRRNSFVYNLSKKFSAIMGTYSPVTGRIIFTKVAHSVTISDASIPVGFWTSQRNVYCGDNRSCASRSKDLFVNDPFLKGIDFLNRAEVISRMEVRFGNDVMYSETAPVSRVYHRVLRGAHCDTRKLCFNFNPGAFFRPTTLTANPSRGKDKLAVRVVYASLDPNNPIYYVPKQLVVVCSDLYRVTYDPYIRVSKVAE